jgi:coproporphyrinogen III oxidase-like Fe-S oxidoreductase
VAFLSAVPYCDFNSHVRRKSTGIRGVTLLADLAHGRKCFGRQLTSIFFGGDIAWNLAMRR